MTGSGSLSSIPNRRLRMVLGALFLWLFTVCLLGVWWGNLLLRQARRISELEGQLGLVASQLEDYGHRTQRMLFWESGTFFVLLLISTVLLVWLYWRDLKRTRSIQAFFASFTHELRTPLTSIRLQAETLADSLNESCSHRHLVQRLLDDSLRLEGQVERTLELARIEGGGPVYTQVVEIKPWIERFLKNWKNDYRDRFDFQCLAEDLSVVADPAALEVIFRNLLENSIRHSKKDKVNITITTLHTDGRVELIFKDNGEGYEGDIKTLGRIFHKGPFSRGTGVGLYLVRVLMERMGGFSDFVFQSGFEVHLAFPEGNHEPT